MGFEAHQTNNPRPGLALTPNRGYFVWYPFGCPCMGIRREPRATNTGHHRAHLHPTTNTHHEEHTDGRRAWQSDRGSDGSVR